MGEMWSMSGGGGGKLVFAVNGERFELAGVDPAMTVLEFLRTETRFKGAKLGCGEGGCGACVVMLSTYDPVTEQIRDVSISSCLTLLCSVNLCSITTAEGLGNSRDGFHSIQQRFAGFHASQCGFCTPGMCMSLFSALVNSDKKRVPEPRNGFSKISAHEAEKSVAGNLCRCTGYRPILDACKSFAADVDLEDLGLNTFWRKGVENASAEKLPFYEPNKICLFPDFLKNETKQHSLKLAQGSNTLETMKSAQGFWYSPSRLDQLHELINAEKLKGADHLKVVAGNTGSGFFKELDLHDRYIGIKGIPELSVIKRDCKGVEIGAAVSISGAIDVLEEDNEDFFQPNERYIFFKLAEHMRKIASESVRNTATIGGNIIMAQRSHFPSDLTTLLLSVCSTVSILVSSERRVLLLEEFLESSPCDHRTLLVSIFIPCWNSIKESWSKQFGGVNSKSISESNPIFETFRASPRPLGNALAFVNAAFLAEITVDQNSSAVVLEGLSLSFGAYGNACSIRARRVENFLAGKPLTETALLEAIRILKETIKPNQGTHSSYRISLAVGFLFKFLHSLSKFCMDSVKKAPLQVPNGIAATDNLCSETDVFLFKTCNGKESCQSGQQDLLSSSNQVVGFKTEFQPVGEPTKKTGAEIQASGEAVYVDDIPSPKDCLYGAFIYSTKPLAYVKNIDFEHTLASQKIVTALFAKDIPDGGTNVGCSALFGDEPLFPNPLVEYAGQPLGIVVAEKQRYANMAAKHAVVSYSTENLEPPVLSVEEAVRRSSFFDVPQLLYPHQVGDFAKGMEVSDQRIVSAELKLGSQYYFYMETQTALAIPDEDNCMLVYSSTQCPENVQAVVAKCLGIPIHNVRVITRRVGGGFGGKALKSMPVATACALAAYKLRRPVRMYMERQTDMVMAGGRHPMKINYSVGFKSDGKITALHVDILINAGIFPDISLILPHNVVDSLKKYNWGALSFDVKVCKTNIHPKSAMRGPGEVQASIIAEAIIEHVASILCLDPNSVRQKNLHNFQSLEIFHEGNAGEVSEYTLPSIFDKLTSSETFHIRVEKIRLFNRCNNWKKRGISCVPVLQPMHVRPNPGKVGILNDGSIVVEIGGVELGQGLWTKVKQMAAFALGKLMIGDGNSILEKVRVIQSDTLSLIQGGYTAASTTSESSCEAVRLACNILVDRLNPLKESLRIENASISWELLIAEAIRMAVNLSASVYWVPDAESTSYLNFGAATSEVEVDLLTGETTILQTDLVYDCGQSLNPAVDLGQIEGAFIQGVGYFMCEEYLSNSDGLITSEGTWTYKIPTADTIPRIFNVEVMNSGHHQDRILSSKASGEPPLLLAASVHCATRAAVRAARQDHRCHASPDGSPDLFYLPVPATMPAVKELCGLDIVERHLEEFIAC